jgi:SAM-dependent methyltransferase
MRRGTLRQTTYDPRADWNGETGARWAEHQDWLDEMLAPFGAAAMEAAQLCGGEKILDIGCGAGATSLELARRVGVHGAVTGVDISKVLLAQARQRATEASLDIEFVHADAASMTFAGSPFELAFSRFGVMFFPDPSSAFAHLRRALTLGGRIAFACWRRQSENEWIDLPLRAVEPLLVTPPPIDPLAPGPFSLADGARAADILLDAGFRNVDVARCDAQILLGRGATPRAAAEDALHKAWQFGGVRRLLADLKESTIEQAEEAILGAFLERASPEGVRLTGAAWIVTARAS